MNMKTLKTDRKAFFYDIDGNISNRNWCSFIDSKSFLWIKKEGHLLFICTGRPYEYASQFFQQYVDGFIASNGRYVIYRNKVLWDEPLNHEQIIYFMKVIRKHHCGFAFIDHDSGYLENQDIQVLEEIMTTYKKVIIRLTLMMRM